MPGPSLRLCGNGFLSACWWCCRHYGEPATIPSTRICGIAWPWARLALGEILVREKSFPIQDPFGYRSVAGPSYDHEWGSAVLFYFLYDRGGAGALIVLKLGVLALTLAYVAKTGGVGDRPWSSGKFLFYALILFALLPSFLPVIRCMVFTHLFFACWLCWLEAWRKGAALSFGLFLVTAVLWANLHGGFVVGLVLMGFTGSWRLCRDDGRGDWLRCSCYVPPPL
jgi:hypothetical protein